MPDSEFTCVTIDMPLDHFDPSDERTIGVTFAVLPASGESQGAFVTVTGGPGTSGIAVADSYTELYDPAIAEQFELSSSTSGASPAPVASHAPRPPTTTSGPG